MPTSKPKTQRLRPRQVMVRGQTVPARIARAPGLDVTARPNEAWPRNAIAAEGETLERTPYIINLVRSGDLVPVTTASASSKRKRKLSTEDSP